MSDAASVSAPAMKEDIVALYERVEALKASDPRARGTMDEVIRFYIDLEKVVRAAGWTFYEYEACLYAAMR